MDKQEFAEYVKLRYEKDPNGSLDRFGKEFIKSNDFSIRIVENESQLSWGESYIGTSFGSTQDYGRRWESIKNDKENQWSPDGKKTEQDLIMEVRERISKHPRQINFYNKDDDSVVTGVVILFKQNGYAIYPDKERMIEL